MTTVLGSRRSFLDCTDTEAMEFLNIVCDIAAVPEFDQLKKFRHHFSNSRYQHCLNVAWYTYIWSRRAGLNYRSATRGAMLHDFFLYDWREKNAAPIPGSHVNVHPMVALANAEKYFVVDDIMRDCILHHMWPSSNIRPSTKEGMLVTLADKYCATMEIGMQTVGKVPPLVIHSLQHLTR